MTAAANFKRRLLTKIFLAAALIAYAQGQRAAHSAVSSYEVSKGSEACCTPAGGTFACAAEKEASRKNAEKKIMEANALYEKGDYRGAAEAYENLLSECCLSNYSAYYNLGNSYYRLNDIGRAVLNFERAAALQPRDEDVRHNLAFIRSMIKDQEPGGFLRRAYSYFTAGELAAVFCAINVIFFALLGLNVKLRNSARSALLRRTAVWCGILLVIAGVWMALRISDSRRVYAVVVGAPCEVRSGPRLDYPPAATLPEGKKVIILGEENGWYAVGLPVEKYKGWIEKSGVEKI
jgi:tetratricopeptide (TPR) repeat protein